MARVLLIDPPWYALQGIYYHNVSYALASLAAELISTGHECRVFNGEFGLIEKKSWEEGVIIDIDRYRDNMADHSALWIQMQSHLRRCIETLRPGIVGITMPTAKYIIAVKIADWIKRTYPHMVIVIGGVHPTIQPEATAALESIDYVVKGEGEKTMSALTACIEKGGDPEDIEGIVYRSGTKICHNPDRNFISDLDALPFPAWDGTDRYVEHPPDAFGTLFTSRGCPFHCTFCASHNIWSRKVRSLSVERVIAELRYAYEHHHVRSFRFADDTFILNRSRVETICESIRRERFDIRWECEVRADLCSESLLRMMKAAGCVRVNIGVESGNPDVLKSIKKGITIDQVKDAFTAIRKADLDVMAYFMIGFPNETLDQVQDTIRLMRTLKSDVSCWSIVTPYPGTELYETAVREGALPHEPNWGYFFHHSPQVHISKTIDHETLLALSRKIQKWLNRSMRLNRLKKRIRWGMSHPIQFLKKYCGKGRCLFRNRLETRNLK